MCHNLLGLLIMNVRWIFFLLTRSRHLVQVGMELTVFKSSLEFTILPPPFCLLLLSLECWVPQVY